ncbi:hypothetical protein [Luteococcus japonicus]|uniref:Uncharacterized protein n=1 Tax=Luteococcus japonicus LSP_Lj1 TaxID=1255658 RepID=A0A1R4K4Y9_9ACTN|nr:hypothetical protein [Luteococcus japonicus]SJN39339.1 hypothetical protein FM114_11480 [Luteococcus japonicus LSP_Lj1]
MSATDPTCPSWCDNDRGHEWFLEGGFVKRLHTGTVEGGWYLAQHERLNLATGERTFTRLEVSPPTDGSCFGGDGLRAWSKRLLELAELAEK